MTISGVIQSALNEGIIPIPSGSSGGTPGGADTQIQYNDGGAFEGSADLTWDNTTKQLDVVGSVVVSSGAVILDRLGAGGANYGTVGQVLTSNGADAAPTWETAASGSVSASAAGSNTQIQYNDGGSFGASADLSWNDSTKVLDVGGAVLLDKLGAGGANYGTTGQVLTNQGSGSNVQWASLPSSLATTSSTVNATGTGNTFSSLPSGLRRVNLTFNGLSTSLAVRIGVRIGGSGGLVTTGYNLASCFFGGGYNGFFNTNDSLFGATGWADASNIYNGKIEITRHSSLATTTNVIYFLQLTMNLSGYNYIHIVQGHVVLPTELTQVRMMPESGNFDSGSIEIDYLS